MKKYSAPFIKVTAIYAIDCITASPQGLIDVGEAWNSFKDNIHWGDVG